jgi:thiamine pyrophosphate-dependent acetolactate synthase large subunit-like protein
MHAACAASRADAGSVASSALHGRACGAWLCRGALAAARQGRRAQVMHEETGGEAIITTGVGQHQMWAAQYYGLDAPRRWASSGGLGSMGFGLPAALGAAVAFDGSQREKRVVVDIDGDGSFLMNCQELATAAIERLDIKILILNNQHLGMVVQWEDRFYKARPPAPGHGAGTLP